jgi:hypothetical protein
MASTIHIPITDSTAVSGSHLAYNRHELTGRAFTAADLYYGRTHLIEPTLVLTGP